MTFEVVNGLLPCFFIRKCHDLPEDTLVQFRQGLKGRAGLPGSIIFPFIIIFVFFIVPGSSSLPWAPRGGECQLKWTFQDRSHAMLQARQWRPCCPLPTELANLKDCLPLTPGHLGLQQGTLTSCLGLGAPP